MTPFASVALFRRNGSVVFKPPRKESPSDITQARKAAMRHWSGSAANGDELVKIVVIRENSGVIEVSERQVNRREWVSYNAEPARTAKEPHLAAAMAELGIDPMSAPPSVPDTLIINGLVYRREI